MGTSNGGGAPRKLPSAEEIACLYLIGYSAPQIARMFGATDLPVRKQLVQIGVLRRRSKHGMWRSPVYTAWHSMKERCKPSHPAGYAARGITVCKEWLESFEAFYAYVGDRPGPGYSIDRIDNSRGYEPGNVRWATWKEQNRNTRGNRLIEANGLRLPIVEWAERLNVRRQLLSARLKLGWSDDAVINTPKRRELRRG